MQSNSVQSTRIIRPHGYLTAVAIPVELAYLIAPYIAPLALLPVNCELATHNCKISDVNQPFRYNSCFRYKCELKN